MKKLVHQTWAKVIAMILCVISLMGSVGSVILILALSDKSYEEIEKTVYNGIASSYSAAVLDRVSTLVQEHPNSQDWKDNMLGIYETPNWHYAVILSDATEKTAIFDSANLQFCYGSEDIWDNRNFDYAFQGSVVGQEKYAEYNYDIESVWSAIYGGHYIEQEIDDTWYGSLFKGFYYSLDTGLFYALTEDGYYIIPIVTIGMENGNEYTYFIQKKEGSDAENEYYYESGEAGILDTESRTQWEYIGISTYDDEVYWIYDVNHNMYKENTQENTERIHFISSLNTKLKVYYNENYYFKGNTFYHQEDSEDTSGQSYWVISERNDNMERGDLFYSASELLKIVSFFEKYQIFIQILCLVICMGTFSFLCVSAGLRTGDNEIHLRFWDKIPFAIFTGVIVGIEAAGGFFIGVIGDRMTQNFSILILLLEAAFILVVIFLLYTMSIAVRIKSHQFWHYTLCGFIFRALRKIFQKMIQKIKYLGKQIQNQVPIIVKTIAILIGVFVIELIIMLLVADEGDWVVAIFWFIVVNIIRAAFVLVIVIQMSRLQKGSQRIAAGDFMEPIDTKGMFWEFKKHAQNINKIEDGISIAVERQMKSEHFRTELITNVSHDIKTPLTSIINYVDLIKKENITDLKLMEYIEVLDRQSNRLKKLIEDLMEASKASTGNLTVQMKECDMNVLITQMVGEFEDKAQNNNLQFVINGPDSPVLIMADSKHIWRVFDNLLNNICKYAMPGTRVYLDIKKQNHDVVIILKNISKSQINMSSEELMERFVRGDSSRNTEGNGLGLAIAQSLTGLMNGSMELSIDGDLFKVILRFPEVIPG